MTIEHDSVESVRRMLAPATLYIYPNISAGGWLEIPGFSTDGGMMKIPLPGRHVRTLRSLSSTLKIRKQPSCGTPQCDPEFVTVDEVRIGYFDDPADAPSAPVALAIRSYFSQINQRIRVATPDGMQSPVLHVGIPRRGYTIARNLAIIYLRSIDITDTATAHLKVVSD